MSQDPELDPRLAALVRGYREPPPVPRAEIWAGIAATRGTPGAPLPFVPRPRPRPRLRPVWTGLGVAALILLGFAIGRLAPGRAAAPAPAVATRPAAPDTAGTAAFTLAAAEHLQQTETFLTLFRASVATGRESDIAPGTARELLTTNRLLLDSPAARSPATRELLQDIELVLAQIAQLPAERQRTVDAELINQGIDDTHMLVRIRSAAPGAALSQGAL